jgi:hypothetical protein
MNPPHSGAPVAQKFYSTMPLKDLRKDDILPQEWENTMDF